MASLEDLFKKENEAGSLWGKFTKVGDRHAGKVVKDSEFQAGKDGYQDQQVYFLEQENGQIMKVGIPVSKEGTIGRANAARPGDFLGFEYEKDIPNTDKKKAAAKAIKVYVIRNENKAKVDASGIPF